MLRASSAIIEGGQKPEVETSKPEINSVVVVNPLAVGLLPQPFSERDDACGGRRTTI
jgi:hypothetical protein